MDHGDDITRALGAPDPLTRLHELTELAHDCQHALNVIREHRVRLINELLEDGVSRRWLARELGISHTAVSNLAKANGKGQ